jgi:hypothetical protein
MNGLETELQRTLSVSIKRCLTGGLNNLPKSLNIKGENEDGT